MPTQNPRFTISLEKDLYEGISEYRYSNRIKTQNQAVIALLQKGLSELGVNAKKAPSLSDEARKMGERYTALDQHGQNVVGMVVSEEERRMEEERKARRSQAKQGLTQEPDAPAKVIPLYFNPVAAGYASPAFGEDFDYIEVGGDVPTHADYAVRIDGDSMEPYIMDGSTVYVNRDPLVSGDVGIFFLDGDMLCKQYVRDEEGNVRLLSLNRARSDADRYVPADSGLTLACYGRVILPMDPDLAEE